MELLYEFGEDQSIANARFEGLDGCEAVSSIKEALSLMQIRNPAITFSDAVKAGMYNDVSDEDYQRILDTIKCVSSLWRYPDDSTDSQAQYQMSALMLLANAIKLISEQHVQLRKSFGQV